MSRPMKSANANGPIGIEHPFFMILSMSSAPPTPVSRAIIDSLMYGMSKRFARNPGESTDRETFLPIFWPNLSAVSNVDSDV